MRLGIDTTFSTDTELPADADRFARKLLPRVHSTEKIVRENTGRSQLENKRYYDRNTEEPKFELGDEVWLRNLKHKAGECYKMTKPYLGLYFIVQKGVKDNYKLRQCLTDSLMTHPVHANRLKAYIETSTLYLGTEDVQDAAQSASAASPAGLSGRQRKKASTKATPNVNENEVTREVEQANTAVKEKAKSSWVPIVKILKKRGSNNSLRY